MNDDLRELCNNEMMQNHVENPRQKPIVPAKPASLKAKQKLKEHLQNDEKRNHNRTRSTSDSKVKLVNNNVKCNQSERTVDAIVNVAGKGSESSTLDRVRLYPCMRPPQTNRSPRPQSTDRILIDRLSQSSIASDMSSGDKTIMRKSRQNPSSSHHVLAHQLTNGPKKVRSKSSSSNRAVTPLQIDNLEKPPPPSRTTPSSGALIIGEKSNRNSLERSSVKSSTSSNEIMSKNEQKSLPTSKSQQFVNYNELELRFKTLTELMTRTLQINESVKNELDELKYEFQLMQGSLSELKNDKKQTIDAINNKLNSNALSNNITCFRCNGRILEYIQLQCGHVFCLHCVHFAFMPEIKIQERTAEALREIATKRKCPTCGERKIDVNIIKKKYRV